MRRSTREAIKDMFALHRSESRGFIVLLVLILIAAGWVTYEQWFHRPDPHQYDAEMRVLDAWLAERDRAEHKAEAAAELFEFDPNGLPAEQWMRLGLTQRQAEAVKRYEEHGGHFRTKADVARIRVIKPELFERWKPFILLPDSIGKPERHEWPDRKERTAMHDSTHAARAERGESRVTQRLEINSCDSAQLVALPGIGPSFARGIIKYREQLGGYVDLDQLREVYILKDKPDAVEQIKQLLVVDAALARRIPINTCTAEELAAHPYARWKIAKPLVAYRQQHGPFGDVGAIKGCAVVTDSVFLKLAPYLSIER